jgi:hypothetical protein
MRCRGLWVLINVQIGAYAARGSKETRGRGCRGRPAYCVSGDRLPTFLTGGSSSCGRGRVVREALERCVMASSAMTDII